MLTRCRVEDLLSTLSETAVVLAGFLLVGRLAGLAVKASASGAENRGSNPACDGIFPGRVIPVT